MCIWNVGIESIRSTNCIHLPPLGMFAVARCDLHLRVPRLEQTYFIFSKPRRTNVEDDSADAVQAAELVFTEAINVYLGIERGLDREFEAWQDYLSVPQWEHDVKVDNILAIPQIYEGSFFTAIYWHDVEPQVLQQLQQTKDAETGVRLKAITHICNAAWSRRVWTAMEYIRSRRVRLLLKDYYLCEESGDLLQQAVEKAWHEEGIRIGDIVELETQAD